MLFCVQGFSQSVVGTNRSSKNKLVNAAFKKGRSPKGFYTLVNEGGKSIKVEKMAETLREEGFIVGDHTTKSISRFGDVATSLSTMQFLPKDEFDSYIYYNLNSDWSTKYEQLTKTGTAYCFTGTGQSLMFTKYDNIKWSGEISNGLLQGPGVGFANLNNNKIVFFKGVFDKGVPVGDNTFYWYSFNGAFAPYRSASVSSQVSHVGKFYDDLASIQIGEKYGFISRNATMAIPASFKSVVADFSNGRATVTNDKEEIIIDRTGKQVDLSARQKKIYADIKAEEERKAEEARQAELAKERERLLAEQKAAEEKRLAEEREADLKRRIEINKNPKLWSRGCRLAYRYPNGKEYVIATLEEWNEDHSRVKIKIVASPSSTKTLNGDLLSKNNMMWVSAHREGWHLATDEEIEIGLGRDDSDNDHICKSCNGRGTIPCSRCNGTGVEDTYSHYTCRQCKGKGSKACYSCGGSGRR